jgi:hypothetical protein
MRKPSSPPNNQKFDMHPFYFLGEFLRKNDLMWVYELRVGVGYFLRSLQKLIRWIKSTLKPVLSPYSITLSYNLLAK